MSKPIAIKAIRNIRQPGKPEKTYNRSNFSIKKIEAFLSKDITLLGKPFSDKVKESFYLELASLMSAGLDIKNSLQLIMDEQSKKTVKLILTEVLEKVVSGKTLSQSLKENKSFTPYEYFTLEIGEETGQLVAVLSQLSIYYKNRIKQRRQIISALTYPAIVLSVALLSVSFMLNYVVPMFADVFKRFGGDLPFLTQKVMDLSHFMQAWAGRGLLSFLILIVILFSNKQKTWYKKYRDHVLQKTPLVKGIISKIYLSRFSSTMQLLLGAKIPLVQALSLSKQVIGFYPLEQSLTKMELDILQGKALHQSMAEYKVFPSKMVALVKVGEEVNQLELFFRNLNERYYEELDYQTTQLSKFIEPVIIVILGLVVGIVLIAMYLPMFNMGNTIG